jgi:peptidoglycan/LPS O-acetylase OafA/YrhL
MTILRWLQSHLTRVTSSGLVIPQLEGMRFLAITAVVMHHILAAYLTDSERYGKVLLPRDWYLLYPKNWLIAINLHLAFAVSVFFAVSGFILALPFARAYRDGTPRPSIRRFYLRRLVRLEPPYVISCLVYFLAIVSPFRHHDPAGYFHAFFPHLLASLVYLHSWIYGQGNWINGVAWSLEVEVQFYLLVPLLANLFRIRNRVTRRTTLLALILACSLLSQLYIEPSLNERLRLSLANYLQFPLAGFLAVDLHLDRRATLPRIVQDALAVIFAALIFFVIHWRPRLTWSLAHLLVPLFIGALGSGRVARLLSFRPIMILGGMCYSIYLYHLLIIQILEPHTRWLSLSAYPLWLAFAIQCALLLPPIFAISAALYLVTERPFMELSRKVSRQAWLSH